MSSSFFKKHLRTPLLICFALFLFLVVSAVLYPVFLPAQRRNRLPPNAKESIARQEALRAELARPGIAGNRPVMIAVYERFLEDATARGADEPTILMTHESIARLAAKMSDWKKAAFHYKESRLMQPGTRSYGSQTPITLQLYLRTLEATHDTQGIAAFMDRLSYRRVHATMGCSMSGAELIAQGLTADEVLDFAIGLQYFSTGEAGDEGLKRGKALVTAVADAHPTNGFVNFCAVYAVGRHPNKMLYGRRAYRYGSQAMRDEMMRVTSSSLYYIANVEAKAMGHPYEKRLFRTYINRADGTVDYVDP